jgi:uncharacterized protein YkwD
MKSQSMIELPIAKFRMPICLLVLLGAFPVVNAQTVKTPAVARLVSEPSGVASIGRPRRVNSEAIVSAESKTASASELEAANPIERRAFEQTNAARSENGLPTLTWDAELCRLARAHSERMAAQGFFSHTTPQGVALKDRVRSGGVTQFRVIGENIAYNKGYDDPGGFAVERWMVSAGHRANILYAGFQSGAIGSFVAADGSVYLTQILIAR